MGPLKRKQPSPRKRPFLPAPVCSCRSVPANSWPGPASNTPRKAVPKTSLLTPISKRLQRLLPVQDCNFKGEHGGRRSCRRPPHPRPAAPFNPMNSGSDFIYSLIAWRLISGEAFVVRQLWGTAKPGTSKPTTLWVLTPSTGETRPRGALLLRHPIGSTRPVRRHKAATEPLFSSQ
jgi:hypothetical protein